jgi:hypothetical protein
MAPVDRDVKQTKDLGGRERAPTGGRRNPMDPTTDLGWAVKDGLADIRDELAKITNGIARISRQLDGIQLPLALK